MWNEPERHAAVYEGRISGRRSHAELHPAPRPGTTELGVVLSKRRHQTVEFLRPRYPLRRERDSETENRETERERDWTVKLLYGNGVFFGRGGKRLWQAVPTLRNQSCCDVSKVTLFLPLRPPPGAGNRRQRINDPLCSTSHWRERKMNKLQTSFVWE